MPTQQSNFARRAEEPNEKNEENPNGAGRRTKFTPELRKQILDAIRMGASLKDACIVAGIADATLYGYIKKHSWFYDSIQQAQVRSKIESLKVITKSIKKHKNVETAKWFLEKRFPDEFQTKVKTENKNSNLPEEKPKERAERVARFLTNILSKGEKKKGKDGEEVKAE